MDKKITRDLEKLNGSGKVFVGETELCSVNYHLKVSQEFIVIDSSKEEIPSLEMTFGTIRVIDGERKLLGRVGLVLRLSDGRKWSFVARKGDPGDALYECENTDGRGIV